MHFSFSYNKTKVLQALRYHFISQKEIRFLFIIIIIFDIISATLYFTGKIRPEPFLVGAVVWFFFILSFWYLMPYAVYKRSATFKQSFTIYFQPGYVALENANGRVEWEFQRFLKFFESPNFFHLYFSLKSFFLVPKDAIDKEEAAVLRTYLSEKINQSK